MCFISALLHTLVVRFEVVLQIATAATPDELGAVVDRLLEAIPVTEVLTLARITRSGTFGIHYLARWFHVGRDGEHTLVCRISRVVSLQDQCETNRKQY
uniref:Putative secreted peptide n=1 Tax=Anopheles braziliensis TaxID=58242 RepID=A0A2M3ZTR2_9DIPT